MQNFWRLSAYTAITKIPLYFRQEKWKSACLHTSAQTTVMGLQRATHIVRFWDSILKGNKGKNKYIFGKVKQGSLETILFRIHILQIIVLTGRMQIVRGNVSFSIGQNLLNKYEFYVNSIKNGLCCPKLNSKNPLLRKHADMYLLWYKKVKYCTLV